MRKDFSLYRFASAAVVSLLLSNNVFAVGSNYASQARQLIDQAQELFIEAGLCSEKQKDCSRKQFILGKGTLTGVHISLYEIDTALIGEVIKLALLTYERNERQISVLVEAYTEPHSARVGKLLNKPKPYLVFELRPHD